MKFLTIPLVVVSMLLGSVSLGGGDQVNKELMKLEGKWILLKGENDGKTLTEEDMKDSLLVIVGNKHTVKVGDTKIVGTHKVDPTGRPKTIDAMDTEGPFKDKTVLGIYEIQGDTFTVCFAPPGKPRPLEFTTKSGKATIYHTWQRQK
jgi:uncharacterized protein (TIGR03067 family)